MATIGKFSHSFSYVHVSSLYETFKDDKWYILVLFFSVVSVQLILQLDHCTALIFFIAATAETPLLCEPIVPEWNFFVWRRERNINTDWVDPIKTSTVVLDDIVSLYQLWPTKAKIWFYFHIVWWYIHLWWIASPNLDYVYYNCVQELVFEMGMFYIKISINHCHCISVKIVLCTIAFRYVA